MLKRARTQHRASANDRQQPQTTVGSGIPQHDEIAARAYELWQQRGCPIGSADQDWTQAEMELQHSKTLSSTS